MERIKLFNEDNLELMKRLPDESIDVICIDPPYLYLKNQKLERPFDEHKFFSECRRLLTKNGFIVMFGRGESFYRWNTILSELKFSFKEEIIWNKSYTTSSMHAISRCHETVVIFGKDAGINNVRVPYLEVKQENISSIIQDIKRIKSALNNTKELEALELFMTKRMIEFGEDKKRGFNTTIQGVSKEQCRSVKTMQSVVYGMKEKSIINVKRNHYGTIHPTEKPVRLLERLLALVIPESKPREEIIVADFFGGSMSCMEAVHNMGMKGIACEIDQEYFEKGKERIEKLQPLQPELFR
ncbi:Modification methylase BamHI [Chryseobacterium gleum]|uniref:Methyltransferase n=3 Tax=Chryseobacterium gleum TaxID=250 RepID=A0A3S4M9B0_CHRGE|nr:DNA (cytosine-5-)-methyltransferase [Chryseobacterium gleum ATCC 35910]QQY32078.1 site-specific DNA-methyltransferase [Chryseobacterium gleum]VEE10701.1 Modification methylase BamHI [Chryseobacterium gleum]